MDKETIENWNSQAPMSMSPCEQDITELWNREVQTDRGVLAHGPNIMIKNTKDAIGMLISVAIPSDRKVIQKETEEQLKYKN
jgi:hypothetical protein